MALPISTCSPPYARVPSYSEVIDVLASGLGISRNGEDALARRFSFDGRIAAYSGLSGRTGLQKQIVVALTGNSLKLRRLVNTLLVDAETELTNARSVPLLTEDPADAAVRPFLEIWAAPWLAIVLAAARMHPGSLLHAASQLLEAHSAQAAAAGGSARFLATWKATIRCAIPDGVSASEFRATIDRIDHRSQRRLASIEQDLVNLALEMQSHIADEDVLLAAVDSVRHLYFAGMAIMRLTAMAADYTLEAEMLSLVSVQVRAGLNQGHWINEVQKGRRIDEFWQRFGMSSAAEFQYAALDPLTITSSATAYDNALSVARNVVLAGPSSLLIEYVEGVRHISHGRTEHAKDCMLKVLDGARKWQLGRVAGFAASARIALRLMESETLRPEELNPLVRVRIESILQSIELQVNSIPTAFSKWSQRPSPSAYDLHLMTSVAEFNSIPRVSSVKALCNPFQRFDATVCDLVAQSRISGATLRSVERKRPAIHGTSIKPYEALRDHLFYRDAVSGKHWCMDCPGMDVYAMLSQPDQLRVLRYVDPTQFATDAAAYDIADWRHPDD